MPYVSSQSPEFLASFLQDKSQLAANDGTTLKYQIQAWALKSGYDDQQLNVFLNTFPSAWQSMLPTWESTYKSTPQAVAPVAAPITAAPKQLVWTDQQRSEVFAECMAEAAKLGIKDPTLVLYNRLKSIRLPDDFCDALAGFPAGSTAAYAKSLKL